MNNFKIFLPILSCFSLEDRIANVYCLLLKLFLERRFLLIFYCENCYPSKLHGGGSYESCYTESFGISFDINL
jgi:hypothetical protein